MAEAQLPEKVAIHEHRIKELENKVRGMPSTVDNHEHRIESIETMTERNAAHIGDMAKSVTELTIDMKSMRGSVTLAMSALGGMGVVLSAIIAAAQVGWI